MGFISASGGIVKVIGKSKREYRLPVFTMEQFGQLGSVWMDKLRKRFNKSLDDMGATIGQKILAMRDFEMSEPTLADIANYATTPEGIDEAIKIVAANFDLDDMGNPIERIDIVKRVLHLIPQDPMDIESLPDPFVGTTTTESVPK